MIQATFQWLKPIQFENANKTRVANLLRAILFAAFILCSLPPLMLQSLGLAQLSIYVVIGLIMASFLFIGLWHFVHQGFLNTASWLFCLFVVVLTTGLTYDSQNLLSPNVLIYIIAIILTTLLLNQRAVIVITLLSIVSWSLLFFSFTDGQFAKIVTIDVNITRLLAVIITLCVIAIFMDFARLALENSIQLAEQKQTELQIYQKTLQIKQASLQSQITERTQSLNNALQESKQIQQELEMQIWLNRGQIELSMVMYEEQILSKLASNVVAQLCRFLNAPIGALYILEQDQLIWCGGFAYQPSSNTITQDNNLILWQTIQKNELQLITQSEQNVLPMQTALINTPCRYLLNVPILYGEAALGVIQIGRNQPYTKQEQTFFEYISDTISIALYSAQTRERMLSLTKSNSG